jgi:hypothetical protein
MALRRRRWRPLAYGAAAATVLVLAPLVVYSAASQNCSGGRTTGVDCETY